MRVPNIKINDVEHIQTNDSLGEAFTMKSVRLSKLGFRCFALALQDVVLNSMSYVQHLVMRAAIALSLKLCLFTARVLLNSRPQAS